MTMTTTPLQRVGKLKALSSTENQTATGHVPHRAMLCGLDTAYVRHALMKWISFATLDQGSLCCFMLMIFC